MRISDWSSDVCSSDLSICHRAGGHCPRAPCLVWQSWVSRGSDFPCLGRHLWTAVALLSPLLERFYRAWRAACNLLLSRDAGRRSRGRLPQPRSEEHTSELQSLMRISYAVFCLTKKRYILLTISTQY